MIVNLVCKLGDNNLCINLKYFSIFGSIMTDSVGFKRTEVQNTHHSKVARTFVQDSNNTGIANCSSIIH